MRLFIAVPIDPRNQRFLEKVQKSLREAEADYRWADPKNIHLTLAFLGETPEEKLPVLKEVLSSALRPCAGFSLSMDCWGAFPGPENPRVVWVGLKDEEKRLESLAQSVRAGLKGAQILFDQKDFKSHLTLGRLRSPKNLEAMRQKIRGEAMPKPGPQDSLVVSVREVRLYQSRLSPQGPEYETLHSEKLSED